MTYEQSSGWCGRSGGVALTVAIGLTLSALGGVSVRADTIHVPNDFPTIQEAINASVDGDEVVVADGTWMGALNKNLGFQDKAITLRSETGNRDQCIIDCENDGRFATFTPGDTAVVQSLTIRNGNATPSGGAAVLTIGSSPSFIDCVFQDCHVEGLGGALAVFTAGVTIDGCLFERNTASTDGGAIFATGAAVVIVESEFLGNTGARGGGIFADGNGSLTVTDSDFTDNEATSSGGGGGGGLKVRDGATIICTDCSFTGNRSPNNGGGLSVSTDHGPASRITGCRFTDNVAGGNGGGANLNGIWDEVISNCVFDGNSASDGGGAWFGGGTPGSTRVLVNCLFVGNEAITAGGDLASGGGLEVTGFDNTLTLINCTFSDNSSEEIGGGVGVSSDAEVRLDNCVLWGNEAPDGPEIGVGQTCCGGGHAIVSYCDVAGGETDVFVINGGTLEWGVGNIDCDPLFDEHKRLSAGSPAIDAADTTAVPKGVTDDIDGKPRFVDDPDTKDTGNGQPPVDMGAHEFQTCPADLDRNGAVGFGDILAVLAAWGPYQPCPPAIEEDIDHDCQVGFSDLLAVLAAWGPCP